MSGAKTFAAHGALVGNIRVDHPSYKEAFNRVMFAYNAVGVTATPICILVTGESRTGKSTVVNDVLSMSTQSRVEGQPTKTVVYAVTPANATIKSLVSALLKGLGDPCWERGSLSSLTDRLHMLLEAVQCRMIILDEFQHLCRGTQGAREGVVADWLKVFVESKEYALVAVGMPESRSIIQRHRQLAGRFDAEVYLTAFDWKQTELRKQFRALLRDFQQAMAPYELPRLDGAEMALRVFMATAGRIGLVARLLDRAVLNAVAEGRKKIRIEDLAIAFADAIWWAPRFPLKGGPFRADLKDLGADHIQRSVMSEARLEDVSDKSETVTVHGRVGQSAGVESPAPAKKTDRRRPSASHGGSAPALRTSGGAS